MNNKPPEVMRYSPGYYLDLNIVIKGRTVENRSSKRDFTCVYIYISYLHSAGNKSRFMIENSPSPFGVVMIRRHN
jgi:hypothetical protein